MQINRLDSGSLSEQTKIALTTINTLKRGVGNPTYLTLHTLSEFFKISISQLTETDIEAQLQITSKASEIPLINLQDVDSYILSNKNIKDFITIEMEFPQDECYAIKFNSTALVPFFDKGTIFVIHRELAPSDGDIVLVKFAKHPPCFRKVFLNKNTYFFKQIADFGDEIVFSSEQHLIYGVVITAIQNLHN